MLEYVEKNFMGECTLKELAQEFNYDYAYLSKYFIRSIEMPFKEYVNRRKISEASHLLLTTDQSILEIAYHSGYQSLRSFNRNFKQLTGFTPSEYREL
jgi:YesN/AraC family two-component response regulator